MQLVEYFIWKYYDNPRVNMIATTAGLILVLLQPVFSSLLLERNLALGLIATYALLLTCFAIIPILWKRANYKKYLSSHRGANGHLVWNWISKRNVSYTMLILYMMFFLFPLIYTRRIFTLIFVIGTLAISLYYFWMYDTWGSMWCFVANVGVLMMLIKIALSKFNLKFMLVDWNMYSILQSYMEHVHTTHVSTLNIFQGLYYWMLWRQTMY